MKYDHVQLFGKAATGALDMTAGEADRVTVEIDRERLAMSIDIGGGHHSVEVELEPAATLSARLDAALDDLGSEIE